MTITRAFLKQIREGEEPFIRQAIELSKHFSEVRKKVADEGGDWGALKSLLKAEILDEEGGDHVKKITDRITESSAYADMLGMNMNEKSFSSSNSGDKKSPVAPLASGEPVRAYSAPSTPSRPPDEQIKAGPHTANGAGSPLSGEPESEPAALVASALGQRESAGDTDLSAGSRLHSDDPLNCIPDFLDRTHELGLV